MTTADMRGAIPPSLWWQIVVVAVGIGVSWGAMSASVSGQMATLEMRIAALEAAGRDQEGRVRSLELGASRQDEKLIGILTGITDLRTQLGRIEEQLRAAR